MGQEHPATVLVVRGQIIEGARGAGLCRLIVARSVAELPERDGWIYGLKFGYRAGPERCYASRDTLPK